jgi:hypothetical protein
VLRPHLADQRPVGHPRRDRPGLARAGAGQDAHRAGGRGDGGQLFLVETGEDGAGGGRAGRIRHS